MTFSNFSGFVFSSMASVASLLFSWWSVSALQLLISVRSCSVSNCLVPCAVLLATTVNLVLCQKLRSDWNFASCEKGVTVGWNSFSCSRIFRILTLQQIQTLVNSDLVPAHHHLLPVELLLVVAKGVHLLSLEGFGWLLKR